MRQQLLASLRQVPGLMVVGQATAERPALALLRQLATDLVLLDLSHAPDLGLNLIRQLRDSGWDFPLFVLVDTGRSALPEHAHYLSTCLSLGATGFFDKARIHLELPERLRPAAWPDTAESVMSDPAASGALPCVH